MKVKRKPVLFSSKARATQRRNSLQRIKDEVLRRNVRVLLSPIPFHLSQLKKSRKSITNFSPRKSITPLVRRRDTQHTNEINVNEQADKPQNEAPIAKSPRKRTRRKNEAEKLQEELRAKKYINEGISLGSRRALRNRLILTPKSPHVRVKRISRQNVKSRKLSLTSLNKFRSFDVVVELEKCLEYENSANKLTVRKEPQLEANRDVCASRVKIPTFREFSIVLEKLPLDEAKETYHAVSEPTPQSQATETCLESTSTAYNDTVCSKVFDGSKDVIRRDVRILLEKLPETVTSSINKTSTEHIDDLTDELESDSDSKNDRSTIDKRCEEPVTPSREIVTEQVASPVTPVAIIEPSPLSTPISTPINVPLEDTEISGRKTPESLVTPSREIITEQVASPVTPAPIIESSPISTPISTPTNAPLEDTQISDRKTPKSLVTPSREIVTEQVASPVTPAPIIEPSPLSTPISTPTNVLLENTQISSRKTPKSLDIPLRRVTIVNSEFKKMIQALKSTGEPTPTKVRPNSTYLFSPSVKSRISQIKSPKPKVPESPSRLESSITDIVSSSSSTSSTASSGEPSTILKSSQSVSSPKYKSLLPIFTPRSRTDTANLPRTSSKNTNYASARPHIPKSTTTPVKGNYGAAEPWKKSSHDSESTLVKRLPKKSADSILQTGTRTESQSEKSPPVSQSAPLCTEVASPLSRGQLLTQKSLASSPNPLQILLTKSPKAVRSRDMIRECGGKTPTKSPMNRGRLLMEQSLAESPKQPDSEKAGKKIRRSVSFGSVLCRSPSNASSVQRESKDVSYSQKWSSAGDLLKISTEGKDQLDDESDSSKDLSPIATPLEMSPSDRVFSNEKTCAAILSTLKTSDKKKSKSSPDNSFQTKTSDVARPLHIPPPVSNEFDTKSTSRSHSDLSQKLSEVKIDPTKPSVPQQPTSKKSFHIPKVKPGLSLVSKTPAPKPPPSSLVRSGFTPSPPAKSTLTQSVLDLATYIPTSYSAPTYSRPAPAKPSQSTNRRPPWIKPTPVSSAQPPSNRSFYSSAIKPTYSSRPQSPPPFHPSSKSSSSHSTAAKPPYTSVPQLLTTKPPPPSRSPRSFFKPIPVHYKDPRLAKLLSEVTAPLSKSPNRPTQSPPSTVPSPKPASSAKAVPDFAKPRRVNTATPSSRSSHKSKSGGLKVAYGGPRSSYNSSFTNCLPSGPLYSPTYSKHLKKGFVRLPDANRASKPATPKPLSPGTSDVLRWSTVKPYSVNRPTSPTSGPSGSIPFKQPVNIPTGPTSLLTTVASKPVTLPMGPSGSFMSSTITSNPEYSPLCPQFD